MSDKSLIRFFFFLILEVVLIPSSAHALCIGVGCSCSASTTGLNFGQYNPKNISPLSITTNIQVSCTALALNTQIGYTVTFGKGRSGNYAMRYMSNNISQLNYNLFRDSNLTQVVGDGSTSTSTFTNNITVIQLLNPYVTSYTIYGKIFPSQNVSPGQYTDSIMITVNF